MTTSETPSRITIMVRALEIRESFKSYGFFNYKGLFRLYFPQKYKDHKQADRNLSRLTNFFSGQINDPEMLKEAEEVLKFLQQTSSKRQAA